MKKIWEFFDNLNESVHVTDMDTRELVYMNKYACMLYGFTAPEDYIGKKCYALLQGSSTPCAVCVSENLVCGQFREWKYFNPRLNRHLMVKNTAIEEDGRSYRFEMAIDVTAEEHRKDILGDYENMETFVNEGIHLALQSPDPDRTIDIILEYLGKGLKAERTYIFEKNEMNCDDNTYEWVADGVTPEKDNLQNVPPEVCENWYKNFSLGNSVIIEELEKIRDKDPMLYGVLAPQDIHSIVVVPLYDGKRVIGFYGVDNPPIQSMDYANNMLLITGHFIISTLKRRDLMRQLQIMSYRDQLTQLGNRHAMNEFIASIPSDSSIGVAYCDITGLKRINDTEGHDAGDRLICRARDSLKEVFGRYGLFRIGGDEMLALCADIDEALLAELSAELKIVMKKHDVNMAVGIACGGGMEIKQLISAAEKQMYRDKADYYKAKNIDRRS